ncbi:MAG TPA: hypothetical protein VJ598_05820, partial [Albitalea sp.]|nr:hypothetical protein [Albitalea sp.]
MQRTPPPQVLVADPRARLRAGAIEWEELPSLAGELAQRLVQFDPRDRLAAGSTLAEFELRFG